MSTSKTTLAEYAVIEPLRNSDHLHTGVMAEATVVDTSSGQFPVRVANLSSEGVFIPCKTLIGVLHPVDSVRSSNHQDMNFKQV